VAVGVIIVIAIDAVSVVAVATEILVAVSVAAIGNLIYLKAKTPLGD